MDTLILVNPLAGNKLGASWLPTLKERAASPGRKVLVATTRKGGIPEQVRELAPGMRVVIMVGGDGTVSEVLDAVCTLGVPPRVGIVPLGTGNDLARSLGLYRGRRWALEEVFGYLESTRTRAVDLWSVDHRLTFSNYASVGLDAAVVRRFCRIRRWIQSPPGLGKRPFYFAMYVLSWGLHLKSRIPPGSRLEWEDDSGREGSVDVGGARVLSITNTPYYAAGALTDPLGRLEDGLVEVTLFPHMRHYGELMAMRIPAWGRRGIQNRWWRVRARWADLHLPPGTPIQADGEDVTDLLDGSGVLAIRRRGQVEVLVR
jgi:diacylglycerol kinase family enzyme